MLYISILMMILYSSFVSSTDFEDSPKYYERVAWGYPVLTQGAYPYLVAIQREIPFTGYKSICGGSLIRPNIMLTAAHCIHDNPDIDELLILPNYRNKPFKQSGDLTFKISSSVVHPLFGINSAPDFQNDVAVVLLDQQDPRLNATISLPSRNLSPGTPVTMIGYGRTQKGVMSDELRAANLTILDDQICVNNFTRFEYNPDFNFCIANAAGSGGCAGDSGSPLVWEFRNMHFIHGIMSGFEPPCGSHTITIFVDVYSHLEFINNAITNLTRQGSESAYQPPMNYK